VSAANFANVNNNGNANYNNASNANGVRPDFESADKTQRRASTKPKGKVVLAVWLNDSGESRSRPCRFALCGALRQANIRGLT